MNTPVTRRPAHVGRVGAAAMLAAAALLGTTTGTLADPATACAKPFDTRGYQLCAGGIADLHNRGEITYEEFVELEEECCRAYGGEWVMWDDGGGTCEDPAEFDEGPQGPSVPQLPRVPGPTEATQPPAPPPPAGPIAPLPGMPPAQTR